MRSDMYGEVGSDKLLCIAVVPSTTLDGLLDTLTANGTELGNAIGLPVSFSLSANFEIDRTANDAIPHGRIVAIEGNSNTGYTVTMEVWQVVQNTSSAIVRPKALVELPYSGTVALGDGVQCNGVTGNFDVSTTGLGVVIAKDTTNTKIYSLV